MQIETLILAAQRYAKHDLSAHVNHDRRNVLGTAIGYLIALNTPLPTSPVTELVNFYVSTHEPSVMSLLNQVNNVEFINTILAAEVARNVYQTRYRLVYEPAFMVALTPAIFDGKSAVLPAAAQTLFDKAGAENIAKIASYYF